MHVVVINHNQQDFVKPMLDALATLSPLFVFDRCEPVEGCHHIVNSEGEGFLAGRMRDLGADGVDDDFLFLDGDKVPHGDILADINRLRDKYDCICYGVSGSLETSPYREFMRVDGADGFLPKSNEGIQLTFGCYSCGMWISNDAVAGLRKLNGGRIFHPAFDGYWGDEDNFVGDELNHLGFKIGYSTHARLAGSLGGLTAKNADDFGRNFVTRIKLNKTILGMK